jgi:hypothetical protein
MARHANRRAASIADAVAESGAIFRKINGEWLVQGRDLKVGQTVEVTKRRGATTEVLVAQLITVDGVEYARTKRVPEPRTESDSERPRSRSWSRSRRGGCAGNPCTCDGMQRWQDCDGDDSWGNVRELAFWGEQFD